jgi:hypothetical protein
VDGFPGIKQVAFPEGVLAEYPEGRRQFAERCRRLGRR